MKLNDEYLTVECAGETNQEYSLTPVYHRNYQAHIIRDVNYLHSRPRNTLIDRRPALVTRIIGTQTENTGIEMATQTSQEQTSIATQTSTIETPPSTSGTAVKFEKLRAALAKIEVPPRNAVKSKPTCGCYCESEDNNFIFTKCGHPFHAICLQKWMNSTYVEEYVDEIGETHVLGQYKNCKTVKYSRQFEVERRHGTCVSVNFKKEAGADQSFRCPVCREWQLESDVHKIYFN